MIDLNDLSTLPHLSRCGNWTHGLVSKSLVSGVSVEHMLNRWHTPALAMHVRSLVYTLLLRRSWQPVQGFCASGWSCVGPILEVLGYLVLSGGLISPRVLFHGTYSQHYRGFLVAFGWIVMGPIVYFRLNCGDYLTSRPGCHRLCIAGSRLVLL